MSTGRLRHVRNVATVDVMTTQPTDRGPYHVSKPVRQGQITLTNALLIAILIVQLIMLSYGA